MVAGEWLLAHGAPGALSLEHIATSWMDVLAGCASWMDALAE